MELDRQLLEKVAAYKPSHKSLDPIRRTPLLFLVGIAGAGKDTIVKRLIADHPDSYQLMVSYTTRKPRKNHGVMEQDGVDYHFIDFATAGRMLDQGEYVEAKCYADNIYGTGIGEIARAQPTGKIVIKDVEVQGVDEYMQLGMNLKPVFLLPPSYEVWWRRLMSRYGDNIDLQDVHKRLRTAFEELEFALQHDYFYILVNDKLEEAIQKINDIAHGQEAEPRSPAALKVLEQLAAEVKAKLTNWHG